MNNNYLVSILIPTYKGEKFLEQTLLSALSQTYSNLEIILSDDGSTDQTLEIAKIFQEKSPFPFKVLAHENLGMVNNWNNCIFYAEGKYIKFLFQDDIITPDCIEKMVNLIEKDDEVGLVFSPRGIILSQEANTYQSCLEIYDGCSDLHTHWSHLTIIQSGQELLEDPKFLNSPMNKIGEPSTVLIKKQVFDDIGTFDPELCQIVDLEMWARIMVNYKIGFIDETLSYFRIHPDQQSIKNIERGEGKQDDLRFYQKLMTASCYRSLPSFLKINIYEKLESGRKQLEKERDDFKTQRDQGLARIKQLEIHESELEAELRKTQLDFFRVQDELEKTQKTLQEMANNKVIKMLKAWGKFKKNLDLSSKK